MINGSVYELFSIPYNFVSKAGTSIILEVNGYSSLTIPAITVDLNETTFQCASFNNDGVILRCETRLIVYASE